MHDEMTESSRGRAQVCAATPWGTWAGGCGTGRGGADPRTPLCFAAALLNVRAWGTGQVLERLVTIEARLGAGAGVGRAATMAVDDTAVSSLRSQLSNSRDAEAQVQPPPSRSLAASRPPLRSGCRTLARRRHGSCVNYRPTRLGRWLTRSAASWTPTAAPSGRSARRVGPPVLAALARLATSVGQGAVRGPGLR